MDLVIHCINTLVSEKGITMEKFLNETILKSLRKIKEPLGIDGKVVYPYPDAHVSVKNDDIYVPSLKDQFMLGYIYPSPITKNMKEDYSILQRFNVPEAPIGWYMSEKFDGQRALWDGAKFITRGSPSNLPRVYPYVPVWIIALMPPGIPLDGEFYTNRNSFQELGFLKSKLKPESQRKKGENTQLELDHKWNNIKFQVFDIPSNEPFEKRNELLRKIVNDRKKVWELINLPPYLKKKDSPLVYTEQYIIKNPTEINTFYDSIVSNEAEGVMIRAPKIPYIPKRTRFMLKLKPEQDTECVIIGYKPGEGKYTNLLGAFQCQLENGKTFYVAGMDDNIRINYRQTHPIGTKITIKYTFLTDDGIPRFPRYKGIPNDR